MIHTSMQENSEHGLMTEVYKLTDAGASVIQIRTREPIRTALVLRKSILTSEDDSEYKEWDVVNGFRTFTTENFTDNKRAGNSAPEDFVAALDHPLSELRKESSSINANPKTIHYFVYVDAHPFLRGNPYVIELVQQYAAILPSTNVCLIFVTPEVTLDDIPAGTILVTDMKTPSAEELQSVLVKIIDSASDDFAEGSTLDEEDIRRISYLGLGLSLYEFETYAAIAVIDASAKGESALTPETMAEGISLGKTAVIKQSEILELLPTGNMSNVGGMKRLKDWVASRRSAYTEEAREFGVETPKGLVTVGVPGTGKSLVASAIADELGIPLVRFDFARVFSKYVGDSESRVRAALKMVEGMAPVVLFVDEIDKGLGGASGGGDSGTSSRVLGSFLTWLQENKAPVFVMVTANNVSGLPPELLRRGRFDQIFSVGMPSRNERLEVLNIHLRKRGRDTEFTRPEIARFLEKSDGYVPAEIESAVKDALIAAFNENPEEPELRMDHIIKALEDMVPMSVSYKERIDDIVAWASKNATPVNYPDSPDIPAGEAGDSKPAARRIGRRSN